VAFCIDVFSRMIAGAKSMTSDMVMDALEMGIWILSVSTQLSADQRDPQLSGRIQAWHSLASAPPAAPSSALPGIASTHSTS
jgi:hypothetical protein